MPARLVLNYHRAFSPIYNGSCLLRIRLLAIMERPSASLRRAIDENELRVDGGDLPRTLLPAVMSPTTPANAFMKTARAHSDDVSRFSSLILEKRARNWTGCGRDGLCSIPERRLDRVSRATSSFSFCARRWRPKFKRPETDSELLCAKAMRSPPAEALKINRHTVSPCSG